MARALDGAIAARTPRRAPIIRTIAHTVVTMDQRPLKLPMRAVLFDVLGAILCAAGLYGVLNPGRWPTLVALALIVVGVAFMAYGMTVILARIRAASRR